MNQNEDKQPDVSEPIPQTEESKTRHEWISVAAYYKAQTRGFIAGQELDDWLAAEKNYIDILLTSYLSIIEEDGVITLSSLQQLARTIGVESPDRLEKVDLIRAIQDKSLSNPCFQLDTSDLCHEIGGCQWKIECRKIIAEWKR